MLGSQLSEECRGRRLKGTTVNSNIQSKTEALDVSGAQFLKIA
jgi:hypothetical protein